jgi:hypothetical protein
MKGQRFRLGLSDGAYGPGNIVPFTVTSIHELPGPGLPNWQSAVLLAEVECQMEWRGECVRYVTLSPRYSDGTVHSIRKEGGIVAVGRVRPGRDPFEWTRLDPTGVDYWAVGVLEPLEG